MEEAKNKDISVKNKVLVVIFSAIMGLVNGVFGSGGGMLAVPILTKLFNLEEKQSHATAIAVILPISIISSAIYILRGNLNLTNGVPVGIGAVVGAVLGALLMSKIKNNVLTLIFSIIMIVAGVKCICG